MAGPSVVRNPKTGEIGSVDTEAKRARAQQTGFVPATEAEIAKARAEQELRSDPKALAKEFGEQQAAGVVGKFRGVGEAFGVPTDQLVTDVASVAGQREKTVAYLKALEEQHPYASTTGEIAGNMFGAAAMIGPGAAAAVERQGLAASLGRIAQSTGKHAVQGGLENTIIGTTHDLNEKALGDPNAAGEKIYARIPKHFAIGAAVGGVLGGGGTALGEVARPALEKGAAAADRGASAAIGREVGERGEAAVAAGERIRAGGAPPRNAAELVATLEGQQAGFRRAAGEEAAARASALEGQQARTAAEMSARQEGARKTLFRQGEGKVGAAEAARGKALLDTAGEAGERVERAELAAAETADKFRGAGLQQAMADAGRQVDDVVRHYDALRGVLRQERAASEEAFARLMDERAANAKALDEAVTKLKSAGADHPELTDIEGIMGAMGRKGDPTARENIEASLGLWRGVGPDPSQAVRRRPRWPKVPEAERGPFGRAKVEPFSAKEVAGYEKELGVRASRAEEFVPIKELRNTEVWEPAKLEALRGRKGIEPVRVTVGEDGVATVEDGIHRIALARESGMTHVPAIVTRYTPASRGRATFRSAAITELFREQADLLAGQGSPAAQREIERLSVVAKNLESAETAARKHLSDLDSASAALEQQAESDVYEMGKRADAQIRAFQNRGALETRGAESFVESTRKAGEKAVGKEAKRTAAEVEAVREGVAKERGKFEKGAAKEKGDLAKAQAKERAGLPKPSEETPVDAWLKSARERGEVSPGFVSPGAGFAAVVSAAHGNLAGAGLALLSSFAAGRARAHGNFVAARALREISEAMTAVDRGIQSGMAKALGRPLIVGAERVADRERKPSKLTFEKTAASIREAQGRPQVLEARVTAAVGPWAKQAPRVYASVFAAAQRAQLFLESKLPQPQRDPYSLTPHLEPADLPESQKYDFMLYVKAIDDPTSLFAKVLDGTLMEQEVEAVKAVYQSIYDQIRETFDFELRSMKKPMEYERGIHIGTLLGIQTDEVLDPDFQRAQSAAYAEKMQQGAPVGSKSPSAESKVNHSMMSTSQRVESGEP